MGQSAIFIYSGLTTDEKPVSKKGLTNYLNADIPRLYISEHEFDRSLARVRNDIVAFKPNKFNDAVQDQSPASRL